MTIPPYVLTAAAEAARQSHATIDQYFDFFHQQSVEIQKVSGIVHRKILLVTLIASLAKGRFPTEKSDKAKFQKLVGDYGDWPIGQRISVVQLKFLADARRAEGPFKKGGFTKDFDDAVAKHFARSENARNTRLVRRADSDPLPNEMFVHTLTGDENNVVEKSTHLALLYQYRSALVHEFREPGGFQLHEEDTVPFYMPTTQMDGSHIADLTYPTGLLNYLVESILKSLPNWYVAQSVNPYDGYLNVLGSPGSS